MKKMDRARKGVHAPAKCGIFNYFYERLQNKLYSLLAYFMI